ncbi:MAG: hypothetical protein AAFN70_05535, partial [Planctomycetota bacterium]
ISPTADTALVVATGTRGVVSAAGTNGFGLLFGGPLPRKQLPPQVDTLPERRWPIRVCRDSEVTETET